MSVVIAVRDKDRFILGADKQTTLGNKKSHNGQKVWMVDSRNFDCCVMGGVGLARGNQIIQLVKGLLDETSIDLRMGPDDSYVGLALTQTIWSTLAANGIVCESEDPEAGMKMKFLPNEYMFAYKDRCWIIHSDMTIEEVDDFGAIGSGEDIALSTLRKSAESKMSPFERIVDAIDECAENTTYIDHNVDFIETIPNSKDVELKMKALGYVQEDIEMTLIALGLKKPKKEKIAEVIDSQVADVPAENDDTTGKPKKQHKSKKAKKDAEAE